MSECPRILITGAAGFVGSAVIKRLLQGRAHIIAAVLADEVTGHVPAQVELVVVPPLSGSSDYTTALQQVDIVIHLAARVHVMQDTALDPLQEFRTVNLFGTERLARQAAECGVRRFVFVSSVKVHGEENALAYREDSPFAPLDPYGVSKAEAELALQRVAEETGLELVVARSPLVYGPGVKANFRQLMSIVQRGLPLPLASIGNRRSLVFVDNLADALACCATHPGAAGQTYMVSDGEDVSTPELIRRVARALGRPARLFPFSPSLLRLAGKIFGKSQNVERLLGSLRVDSSRIREELGWTPAFTMDQGLKVAARWFMDQKPRRGTPGKP
jgi:nucleoside-diphosphate-sugar epimerase